MSDDLQAQTAAALRHLGRDDLADQLEAPPDEANGNVRGLSIFGGTDQGDAAAVAAALRRDLGDDR